MKDKHIYFASKNARWLTGNETSGWATSRSNAPGLIPDDVVDQEFDADGKPLPLGTLAIYVPEPKRK